MVPEAVASYVHLCGGFLKWGYPNSWMVYKGRSIYKWMIWGYPHFWKPSCGNHYVVTTLQQPVGMILPVLMFAAEISSKSCSGAISMFCGSRSTPIIAENMFLLPIELVWEPLGSYRFF